MQAIGAAQHSQRSLPPPEPEADYTLKIPNFTRKLAQANSVSNFGVKSEPFFSSHGYKMELMIKLNEAPSGQPQFMGLYLVLMQSDRDSTLSWPFTKRFSLVLIDQQDDLSQRQNIKVKMIPRGEEVFQRPWQRENKGAGISRFVKHSTLHTRQYMRDDTVYIKVFIEP